MKTSIRTVVLTLMLLQGSATSQESYAQEWCNNLGLAFHQVTSWREQGTTMKQSMEVMAQAQRETTSMPKDLAQTYRTLMLGVIVHVYKHPMYRGFGPEMNRNLAQERCEQVGAENFMKDIDTGMRKLISQK